MWKKTVDNVVNSAGMVSALFNTGSPKCDDLTTEHFITIVGMGDDSIGRYFLFYDNAVGDASVDIGASLENKLYCNPGEFKIEGTGDVRNEYIQYRTNKRKYIISQVRETK